MKTLANAPLAHPTFDWAHCTNHRTGDICLRFTAGKFSDVCVSTNIGLMIADSTTDGSGDIKTAVGLIETNHIGFSVCLSIAELLLKEFDFFDYVYSRKLIGLTQHVLVGTRSITNQEIGMVVGFLYDLQNRM